MAKPWPTLPVEYFGYKIFKRHGEVNFVSKFVLEIIAVEENRVQCRTTQYIEKHKYANWVSTQFVFECTGPVDTDLKKFVALEEVMTDGPSDYLQKGWGGARYEFRISDDNQLLVGCVSGHIRLPGFNEKGFLSGPSGYEGKDSRIFLHCSPRPRHSITPALDGLHMVKDADAQMKALYENILETKTYDGHGPHVVSCAVNVAFITDISTQSHSFRARCKLTLFWDLYEEDFHTYYMQRGSWRPRWEPGQPIFKNLTVEEHRSESPIRLARHGGHLCAVQSITLTGQFQEIFELKRFPFDSQEFKIDVEFVQDMRSLRMQTVGEIVLADDIYELSEWHMQSAWHNIEAVTTTSTDFADEPVTVDALRITLFMARASAMYVWRVIVVLGIVSLFTLVGFVLHPIEKSAERLSFAVTMLLTASAYSIVVGTYLPILKSRTVLDNYSIFTFFFIALFTMQVGFVALVDDDDVAEAVDVRCFNVDLALWVMYNIFFVVSLTCGAKRNSRPLPPAPARELEKSDAEADGGARAAVNV